MKQRLGFTIIEIIVVITAIAILAGIGTVSYSALQVRARDNERQADIDTMRAALETYYEQKGDYPALITSPANAELAIVPDFYTSTLQLPSSALVAPGTPAGTTFSWTWGNTVANSNQYALATYHADGSGCVDTAPCTRFVLTWRKESDGSLQTVLSKFGN